MAIARGGFQFMLIIWLQGIWLPLPGRPPGRHPATGLVAVRLGTRRDPLGHLLAVNGGLAGLPAAARQNLTGREFFPGLISGPFQHGLIVVSAFATVLSALAALASARRGNRFDLPAAGRCTVVA